MPRFRAKRSRPPKATIAVKRITRAELRAGALLYPPVDGIDRPRTWGECRETNEQPCPFVSCRHHLYLDVNPETGSITLNFPDLEPWELNHSCALHAAEMGAHQLEAVGARMNLTRERIRQLERIGLHKLKAAIGDDATDVEREVAA